MIYRQSITFPQPTGYGLQYLPPMCKNHHLCHEKLSQLEGKSVFQPSYRLCLIVRVIAGSLISRSRSFAIKMASRWGLSNRLQKTDPRVKRHQAFALFIYSQTNILDVSMCVIREVKQDKLSLG